jgi:hypothetical protein
MHANQRGSRKRKTKPLAEKTVHCTKTERPDIDAPHPIVGKRSVESEGSVHCAAPAREDEAHGKVIETPSGEMENGGRRSVQPLDVVDRDDERTLPRERPNGGQESEDDSPLIGGWPCCLLEEKGNLERVPLGAGKIGEDVIEDVPEEVDQRRIRELRLYLGRTRDENADRVASHRDAGSPERRLPDTRFTFDDECGRPVGERGRKSLQGLELSLPAENSC